MSILNVNKINPVGGGSTITVAAGVVSCTGKIDCIEFDNNPSFTGNVTIAGNLGVAGTITYEDVARIDATGISTFREGFGVGPLTGIAATVYKDGSIRTTGIITASSFVGNVTGNLTGTASTATNAAKAYALDSAANITTGIVTATAFVSDTPFAYRNMIINGAMVVDQRGDLTVSNSNASRQYGGPDRFFQYYYNSGEEARYTFKQGGAGVSPVDKGFPNCAHIDVTTADASWAADHALWTGYRMEGYDAAHLKYGTSDAESLTLSFWIKSSVTGTYSILLGHTDMDERYITTYTVNSADTWEKKIITFPGDTRSGKTIAADNASRLNLKWVWLYGTNRDATPNTWATQGNVYGASGVTPANIFSSTSNNLYLTGVQLEVGPVATPFENRSYADELARCQRYYEGIYMTDGTALMKSYASHGGGANFEYQYAVQKRARPTWSLEGNASWSGATPNAFESKSSCVFQVNNGTLFTLSDAVDDLCGSFSAEL